MLDQILLRNVPLFDSADRHASGSVTRRVIDMARSVEDSSLRKEEKRADNAEIKVWDFLVARLAAQDSRIAKKNGTCFTSFVKDDPRLKQKMQFGSPAMETLTRNLSTIVRELNDEFRLQYEYDDVYQVKSFNLVSPDLPAADDAKRERYQVRAFTNALHPEYNGLNPFEVKVAEALDTLGLTWCRNPSKTGYGIPIPEIGAGTANFYPDFLLWTPKCLWAIDPKGAHLVNDAIRTKLMGLQEVDEIPLKIRVALILEGEYLLGPNDRPQKQGPTGCTLVFKRNAKIVVKPYANPVLLVEALVKI